MVWDLELHLTNVCGQAEASADGSRGSEAGTTDEIIHLQTAGRGGSSELRHRLRGRGPAESSGSVAEAETRYIVWKEGISGLLGTRGK